MFIKVVNALICYKEGMPSNPGLLFLRDEIIVLMSMHMTVGTTILLTIPFKYVKGSFEHVILLANVGPIETNKLLIR